jgi:hypothetical protein
MDVDFLGPFRPHGTGPGYTVSATPAVVASAPAFSLPNPFRTDLPADLNPEEFATEETARALAAYLGGTARLETSAPQAFPVPWMVDLTLPSGKVWQTWNAGLLYLYLQAHAGFRVPTQ